MSKKAFIHILLGAILLQGCAMYSKPDVPPIEHPEAFKVTFDAPLGNLNFSWWENFNDPTLNDLVQHAIKNNYNYQVSLKNIDIAQTYVYENMSGLLPTVTLDMENTRNNNIVDVFGAVSAAPDVQPNSGPFNLQLLSATATYEIDVWNQVRNSIKQSKADMAVSQAQADVIRLTLIASVVNTYYQIMALNEKIDLLKEQLLATQEIFDLIKIQYMSGLVNQSDVYTASTNVQTSITSLAFARKQKATLDIALAYLVGEYPEDFMLWIRSDLTKLDVKKLIPEGIPSVVVGLRPDIQSAFQTVLSYGYIEKQNIANFLPTFSLTGTYGYANSSMAGLIKSGNAIWSYGLSTIDVLFNYPALYSQYQRSKIQYESAVLLYQDSVIKAFKEVDSALVSFEEDALVYDAYQIQKNNASGQLAIVKAQYSAGLVNYVSYLSIKYNDIQASLNLTDQHLLLTQDVIQAYKTMGLGLEVSPTVQQENNKSHG